MNINHNSLTFCGENPNEFTSHKEAGHGHGGVSSAVVPAE